jgi:hypothetical protein
MLQLTSIGWPLPSSIHANGVYIYNTWDGTVQKIEDIYLTQDFLLKNSDSTILQKNMMALLQKLLMENKTK